MNSTSTITLPGLDCGLCGYRHCSELAESLGRRPEMIRRCVHLKNQPDAPPAKPVRLPVLEQDRPAGTPDWIDSLSRPFDFFLEKFPEEPGPREIILPHNPILTREMEICPGDVLIGRPLGMSCGCPITHCGIATEVDRRTGVIAWCVTGPLKPRESGFKDLGYYVAEAYEGLVTESRTELRIGARYFFQPRMCMLQWRHSGLINYLNRTPQGMQIRIEGLWIG
ncbi:MAG: (Fe-S)-binding protein [Tepidisphaeraceae bacterium]|jgi:uncharacterized Fe-S cluster-containing protein